MQSDRFKRRSHIERIAIRRELESEQLAKSASSTGEFFAYSICLWCGNNDSFVATGESTGCTDDCSRKLARSVGMHQRIIGYRAAERYDFVPRGRVYQRDQGICQRCGDVVPPPNAVPAESPNAAQLDHIVPVADGGDNTLENLQLTHAICNNASQTGYKRTRARRRADWYAANETRNESPVF